MAGPGEEREVPDMVHDERPEAGLSGAASRGSDDIWARADPAEQASAAGPASSGPDLVFGRPGKSSADVVSGTVLCNPAGYIWRSVVERSHFARLKKAADEFPESGRVISGDGVERKDLDVWQRFAFDIVSRHQQERVERNRIAGNLRDYHPLRLFQLGTSGSGKSRLIRAEVRHIREAVARAGGTLEDIDGVATLAAPTGCASFRMKYGASTVHRQSGVPIGPSLPWTDKNVC